MMFPFVCELMNEATEPFTTVLQHFLFLAKTMTVFAPMQLESAHSPSRICLMFQTSAHALEQTKSWTVEHPTVFTTGISKPSIIVSGQTQHE